MVTIGYYWFLAEVLSQPSKNISFLDFPVNIWTWRQTSTPQYLPELARVMDVLPLRPLGGNGSSLPDVFEATFYRFVGRCLIGNP